LNYQLSILNYYMCPTDDCRCYNPASRNSQLSIIHSQL